MTVRALLGLSVILIATGCSTIPPGTYFPRPTDPATARIADVLRHAALAAGDEPSRYSFAFVESLHAAAYSDEDATFYVTDGLARLPMPVIEAMIAHEVAHEVLGHVGRRRTLSLALSASFAVVNLLAPGLGLLDFALNPLAIRAFSRSQELEADQKAVEILRAMGHARPRRSLAEALSAVGAVAPKEKEGLGGFLSPHPALEERLAALDPLEPTVPPRAGQVRGR